jgi:uncharacterized membrane protein YagU involved in acid resistance
MTERRPSDPPTPLGALVRGVLAGVVGTAAMSGWQAISQRLRESDTDDVQAASEGNPDPWEKAPVPAKVGKRVIEGVFHRAVPPERIALLTNVVHWSYGTAWGAVFGLTRGTARRNPLAHGLLFGTGVWAMSYVELVPAGLYKPPWEYPAREVAFDISYHLVYGVAVAASYELLDRELR